jgi:acyl carrier protein
MLTAFGDRIRKTNTLIIQDGFKDQQHNMSKQTPQEHALAQLIVEALELEEVGVETIEPEAPLFGPDEAGLGLDSIDALEIALAISREYRVELRADDEENKKVFATLRSLTNHVEIQRDPV